jgi:hypothetical protein
MSNTRRPRARSLRRPDPEATRGGLRAQPPGVDPRRWQALLAEARGDPSTALRLLTEVGEDEDAMLVEDLTTMARHGDQAPPWLIARWLTRQALRWMRLRGDDRYERARILTLRGTYWLQFDLGVEELPPAYARALADDWVTREIALYGYQALDDFLDCVADPRLVDTAGDVRTWTRMPLRAYRLGATEEDWLPVTDLTTSGRHEVFDLGAGTSYPPGAFVLGRVVPVGDDLLFESLPLLLDERTAVDIATAGPPQRMNPVPWAPLLTRAIDQDRLPPMPGAGLLTPLARDEPAGQLPDDEWEPPPDPRLSELAEVGLDAELAGWVAVLEEGLRLLLRQPAAAGPVVNALERVLPSTEAMRVVRAQLTGAEFASAWGALAECVDGELRRTCASLAAVGRAGGEGPW